jgi:hypothetical protein
MKNIIKLSLLTVIFAFAISCDKDQIGARFIDGDRGVSFDNAKYQQIVEGAEFYIHVARVSAAMEETIGLTHDAQYHDIFAIPTTVSFAKGEYEKSITIFVDTVKMAMGIKYVFNLKLEEKASIAGINTTEVSVTRPISWTENIGYSTFSSEFYGDSDPIPTDSALVGTSIWYRLRDCFYHIDPEYVDKGYHFVFIVDESGNVSLPYDNEPQCTGDKYYDINYGDGYTYLNFVSATKTGRTIEFKVKYDLPKTGGGWSNTWTETVILP